MTEVAPQRHTTELLIGGMTCSSCSARVERKLNKIDGVQATVNLATEKAHIDHGDDIDIDRLISTVEAAGYHATLIDPRPAVLASDQPTDATTRDDHADTAADLRRRLVVSATLSIPVLLVSMIPPAQFDYWQWLCLVLASPVALWGAWPFHRAAWVNLRHGGATMDTLVSVGVLASWTWSLWALFFSSAGDPTMRMAFELMPRHADGTEHLYFETAAMVTVLILLGRTLEAQARRRSGDALRALLDLGAKEVTVVRDGAQIRIPVESLAVGDEFIVRPGEKIATDGVVLTGSSAVDTSLLTGEPVPVDVTTGDPVTGACLNTDGLLHVRATRVGADTRLAQITRLVEEAQTGKAQVQRLADRIAAIFVPTVILLSMATLAGWLLLGQSTTAAFTAAVAVLVIACPCALGLATPTALMVGTGRGAQLGILIKGPQILESTRRVDTVVLDKTGTVTSGVMSVRDVIAAPGEDPQHILRLAAAVEHGSAHPIAAAITAHGRDTLGDLPTVTDFTSHTGLGVTGTVDAVVVTVGRHDPAEAAPAELLAAADAARGDGATVVWVGTAGTPRGIIVVTDTVRATSAQAIAKCTAMGLTPILLTGDNERAALAIARDIGIDGDHVIADVMPHDKVAHVARLQKEGRVVAMVGDGVNDAAALAQADLGLAMGTGSDVAIEAGDLTLVRGDLLSAVDAIRLSRRTLATIKGNLFWAFAYNGAAIPLAVVGLLNPIIASGAMAFSSVFVVTNSLRLRSFQPYR
ncbi:Copper-exporting P-type ATPase [Austwickia sp. TVS 96-490-7B]|uniref:heavy metal translocating P-type ATPase n=1 Tax=Austwickia sp. TVS 96-490-7B TaxID=2830843 RepID=UPI001C57BEF6|nr:heavy metal translocating P-type ATPase [Austwickia sp. TVS 96-490-7B]MBW3086741.1 Copper-exporting P-type ATPase [Austwickia sp. TVS 96-490-7B]